MSESEKKSSPAPDHIAVSQQLVNMLDEILTGTDWEATRYLAATAKKLRALQAEANQLLADAKLSDQLNSPSAIASVDRGALRPVYIGLYQADGNDLNKWVSALRSLVKRLVGRPIYADEDAAIKAVRARGNLVQEGYALVYIDEADVLTQGRPQTDHQGSTLLVVRETAVVEDNIAMFVHANDNRYHYQHGRLTLIEAEPNSIG